MDLDQEDARIGRKRITQVFRYLEALNQLRNPANRQIQEQLWTLWLRDLPDHPSVRRGILSETPPRTDTQEALSGDDFVLKVRRPVLTPAPIPHPKIREWLRPGWDNPISSAQYHESRNEINSEGNTVVLRFDEDPERAQLFRIWQERRDTWLENEVPAREALKIFERLYELYGEIKREEERGFFKRTLHYRYYFSLARALEPLPPGTRGVLALLGGQGDVSAGLPQHRGQLTGPLAKPHDPDVGQNLPGASGCRHAASPEDPPKRKAQALPDAVSQGRKRHPSAPRLPRVPHRLDKVAAPQDALIARVGLWAPAE